MDAIQSNLRALGVDNRGATVIEYGLIMALITLAIVSSLGGVGGGVAGGWDRLAAKVDAVM